MFHVSWCLSTIGQLGTATAQVVTIRSPHVGSGSSVGGSAAASGATNPRATNSSGTSMEVNAPNTVKSAQFPTEAPVDYDSELSSSSSLTEPSTEESYE